MSTDERHTVTGYPKDGSTFVTETIERTAYRWAKYKPDGARQMGKPGRWQKQVWSCDYFRWENCDDPSGEICQPFEDGPISLAFKAHASLTARVAKLEASLTEAADQLALAHDDAFKQCAGYGLVTSDGREFSCFQLNKCEEAAHAARAVLVQSRSNG